MATVQKIIDVDANVEDTWNKIADVGSIANLVGFISESQSDGDIRVCKMADGGVLREQIISIDNTLRRVSYCITDSPLNLEFHSASMQVVPWGQGASLIWTTDMKPDAAAEQIALIFEEAVPGIKMALEGD